MQQHVFFQFAKGAIKFRTIRLPARPCRSYPTQYSGRCNEMLRASLSARRPKWNNITLKQHSEMKRWVFADFCIKYVHFEQNWVASSRWHFHQRWVFVNLCIPM